MDKMFDKKILLWASAAVLALLAVLLLLSVPLRPRASSNEDFGYVKDVYTYEDEEWIPVKVEGDTDAFPSAVMKLSVVTDWSNPDIYDFDTRTYVPYSSMRVTVHLATTLNEKVVHTSRRYENGKPVGEPEGRDGYVGGYVERLVDGEWVVVAPLSGSTSAMAPGSVACSRDFSTGASGEYRFTCYFREYISGYVAEKFSTGEELYTVSLTVTIPEPRGIEPSGKRFDLLSFTLNGALDRTRFELALRPNGVDAPCLQDARIRLQRLDGEKWVDVETDPYSRDVAIIGAENRTATVFDADGERVSCYRLYGYLYTPQSGSYRLILGFTEQEYGRGKKNTLTLYFDIPGENVITLRPDSTPSAENLVPVENLSGDYEFFESISISKVTTGSSPDILLYFEPKGERRFTAGSSGYTENVQTHGHTTAHYGVAGELERYEDGEWVHLGEVGTGDSTAELRPNYQFIEHRTFDTDERLFFNHRIGTGALSPGRHRITVYFRERFTVGEDENGRPLYTSGGELYSVSFEFDVPKPNGEPYEIVYAADGTRGSDYPHVDILVRRNPEFGGDRELFYVDNGAIVLEKLESGEWVEMQPHGGNATTVYADSANGNGSTSPYELMLRYPNEEFDYSATYRITLPLSEFPDGQGKTYDLQFSFKFPE